MTYDDKRAAEDYALITYKKLKGYTGKDQVISVSSFLAGLQHRDKQMEERAIGFAEWILKQGWNLFGDINNRFWRLNSESKTTKELYQIYLDILKP